MHLAKKLKVKSFMQRTRGTFLAIAMGLLLFLLLLGFPETVEKQPDSEGYLLFAKEISSGDLFFKQQAHWPSVIRTPAFPAMLALSQAFVGDNPAAVILVHLILATLALVSFVLRFKKYLAPSLLVFLSLLSFWLWREYYSVVLSEWSAFCALLIFLSFVPQSYVECSPIRLFLLGILLSFLVLIRPAFLSCLLVVALIVILVVKRSERRRVCVGLLLGLLPLFLWCTFNSYRLGTFNVAAFTGHNIFGVATLIGSTDFRKEEWPDLSRFAEHVNSNKIPAIGEEENLVAGLPANYFGLSKIYNHNVYKVALDYDKGGDLSRQYYDSLMSTYAKKVIIANPLSYLKFIFAGLGTLLRDAWFLIMSGILLYMLIKAGHPLSLVLAASLATHTFHILLCSAVQIVISRYYLLTFIPLGLFTVLSMLAVIKARSTSPASAHDNEMI